MLTHQLLELKLTTHFKLSAVLKNTRDYLKLRNVGTGLTDITKTEYLVCTNFLLA